jgi:hypothetical protein
MTKQNDKYPAAANVARVVNNLLLDERKRGKKEQS